MDQWCGDASPSRSYLLLFRTATNKNLCSLVSCGSFKQEHCGNPLLLEPFKIGSRNQLVPFCKIFKSED